MSVHALAAPARPIALPQWSVRPTAARVSASSARCADLRKLRPATWRSEDFPSIGVGSRDRVGAPPIVTTAQLLLRRYYVTLRADGVCGPQTRAAIRAFQVKTKRPTTGVLSASDWVALTVRSEVGLGSRGNVVRAVQVLLNHRREPHEHIVEDGVFGTGTLMRVQDVQRAGGVAPSRSVNTATFAALLRR